MGFPGRNDFLVYLCLSNDTSTTQHTRHRREHRIVLRQLDRSHLISSFFGQHRIRPLTTSALRAGVTAPILCFALHVQHRSLYTHGVASGFVYTFRFSFFLPVASGTSSGTEKVYIFLQCIRHARALRTTSFCQHLLLHLFCLLTFDHLFLFCFLFCLLVLVRQ